VVATVTFFAVANADTLAKKTAAKSAGCTHIMVQAVWGQLQSSAGGSLVGAEVTALNTQFDDCRSLGLSVIFEHALQYPPAFVQSGVEQFKDQSSNNWTSATPGKNVRNWMWNATGRTYVSDFYTKVWAALSSVNRAAVAMVRFGGGYFGELQYPPESLASPYSYWGFGTSMQTGTGLAAGLSVCPNPGYTPFSGTDAQDVQWINWYMQGLENWTLWQVSTLKTVGWTQLLMCLHPGFGIRVNQPRSDTNYRGAMAAGQDCTRIIGCYKNDPQVWPWCTGVASPDQINPTVVDTDQAQWKKLYADAAVRGKFRHIAGENSGGEDNTGMNYVFANPLASSTPTSGMPLFFGPNRAPSWQRYQLLMWVTYDTLVAGGANATMANYQSDIASN
jgi:hypothetical protein